MQQQTAKKDVLNTSQQLETGTWSSKLQEQGRREQKEVCFAYEAANMQGDSIFYSAVSSSANTLCGAPVEAIAEAAIRARNHNFQ